jgi:predicted KAP-like P-loop ATPase
LSDVNADGPITTKADDRLHYLPFSQALAKAVVHRALSDGFVIGVQAQWGMGKSSAINLALEAIRELEHGKSRKQQTKVQPFNPWLFSGLEALVKGYLSQLGRVIDETLDQGTPQSTRRFVDRLVKGGAEMVGGAAAIGAVALTGGAAAPVAMAVKSTVTGALNLAAHHVDNRSLDQMIEDLKGHLNGIDCKILVVVDDLDRLQPDELRQILTLVKTFGNLPNVIHLLVYDREILVPALGGPERGDAGVPSFLEKIVQVELNLPPPSSNGLKGLALDRLTKILGPAPDMQEEHWWKVSQVAFDHYLRSPRDVVRFCNALSVTWPGLSGEVYVPDLLGIELLRHFDASTYNLIRDNKDFLTGNSDLMGEDSLSALGRTIVESVHASRRDAVVSLLVQMFPHVREHLKQRAFSGPGAPPMSGRRIGSGRGFDAYFRFSASPDEIKVGTLRDIAENLRDEEFLLRHVKGAMERTRSDGISFAAPLLEELTTIIDSGGPLDGSLLNILLQVGDELIATRDEVSEFFLVSNGTRLRHLLEKILGAIPAAGRPAIVAAAVAQEAAGIHVSAFLLAILGQDHGLVWPVDDDLRDQPLLSLEKVKEIGASVVARIQAAVANGTLKATPLPKVVLSAWKVFGNAERPRSWVSQSLGDPGTLVPLALAYMTDVQSSAWPYRFKKLEEIPDPEVIDLPALIDALERHRAADLVKAEDREDVDRFINQAQRRMSQLPAPPLQDGSDQEGAAPPQVQTSTHQTSTPLSRSSDGTLPGENPGA